MKYSAWTLLSLRYMPYFNTFVTTLHHPESIVWRAPAQLTSLVYNWGCACSQTGHLWSLRLVVVESSSGGSLVGCQRLMTALHCGLITIIFLSLLSLELQAGDPWQLSKTKREHIFSAAYATCLSFCTHGIREEKYNCVSMWIWLPSSWMGINVFRLISLHVTCMANVNLSDEP